MTVKFKHVPTGMFFILVFGTIEYLGKKIVPFTVTLENKETHRINALLTPKEKEIYGSEGVIANIPKKFRVRLAA